MKQILLLLAVLVLPTSGLAQGRVIFANTGTTLFYTNGGLGYQPISGSNTWRIGLYIAPVGTTDPSLFSLTAVATNTRTLPGRFSYPEAPYTIAGNNGTPIAYQIRVWALAAGETYEATTPLSLRGVSSIGTVTPALIPFPPPSLFGEFNFPSFPGQLTSGILMGVPEPSTYALAALGTALFIFCRKRKRRF